ncbi:MAG: hypothetical protein R3C30_05145 [Hyphomonadaceae bacterium]
MTSRVVLVHSANAGAQARSVANHLAALGYDVSTHTKRAALQRADKVVVLWSREARGTPSLRAVARLAQAGGKLVCVRLDTAPPPVEGAPNVRLADRIAWRRILSARANAKPVADRVIRAPIQTARAKRAGRPAQQMGTDMRLYSDSTTRAFAIVLTLCLLAATGLGIAYSRYPQVAAPIDQAASVAYEQASELAALAP